MTWKRLMTSHILGKNGVHPRREDPGYAYVILLQKFEVENKDTINSKLDYCNSLYVKPSYGVIMAILNCCLMFIMMRISNCLEVCYTATAFTVFISYFTH